MKEGDVSGMWMSNHKIMNPLLISLAQKCTSLSVLCLSGCVFLQDQVIDKIAEWCHGIEVLEINHCHLVTDQALARFIEKEPNPNPNPNPNPTYVFKVHREGAIH